MTELATAVLGNLVRRERLIKQLRRIRDGRLLLAVGQDAADGRRGADDGHQAEATRAQGETGAPRPTATGASDDDVLTAAGPASIAPGEAEKLRLAIPSTGRHTERPDA